MNRTKLTCPQCQSNAVSHEHGADESGSQPYRCDACLSYFTLQPHPEGQLPALREQARRVYLKSDRQRSPGLMLRAAYQTGINLLALAVAYAIFRLGEFLLLAYYGLLQIGADKGVFDETEGAFSVLSGVSFLVAAIIFAVGFKLNWQAAHERQAGQARLFIANYLASTCGVVVAFTGAVTRILSGLRQFRGIPYFNDLYVNVPTIAAIFVSITFFTWLAENKTQRQQDSIEEVKQVS